LRFFVVAISTYTHIRSPENRPAPTFKADRAGKDLKAIHKDTILLTLGELDISPTNGFLARAEKEAAKKAASDPLYKLAPIPGGSIDDANDTGPGCNYPLGQGTPELRAVAAHVFTKDTGIRDVTANDITVSQGGKAVLNAIGSNFASGDEVIVAGPGWPTNYDFWPVGTKIIEVDTDGRGLMTPEQLEQALKEHPGAKAVLINDPCNPTGARYGVNEREAVMKVINDARGSSHKNLMAVVDDPYGALLYNGATMIREKEEKALFNDGGEVIANSVSKVYARPDLRVGYAVTKNAALTKTMVNYIQTAGASVPVEMQNKAQLLLLFGDNFKKETAARLEKRSVVLADRINAIRVNEEQLLSMGKPQGAIYGWINCEKLQGATYKGSDNQLHTLAKPADVAEFMRDIAHVAPVEGNPFYADKSPAGIEKGWYMRVVLTDEKILETACERMEAALNQLTTKMPARSVGAMQVANSRS
jgi:aspartate/methionine/tyrosine aminotransferase